MADEATPSVTPHSGSTGGPRENSAVSSVVIRTMADEARAPLLFRAIQSVRDQDVPCEAIVVVNGARRDPGVMSRLQGSADVTVVDLGEPDAIGALVAGADAVRTPYYGFLDDDDVLLPDSMGRRQSWAADHPEADVIVSQGASAAIDGSRTPLPRVFPPDDPMRGLLSANWLVSCGALFRRDAIPGAFLADVPRFLEWTYLAFKLLKERNVTFMRDDPEPHFIVHETPGSDSRSYEYVAAMPAALRRILDLDLDADVATGLRRKVVESYHDAADFCLRDGRYGQAWRFHLRCLIEPHGIRYLPFVRHLIRHSVLGLGGGTRS